jgi:hypothetical protein
MTSSRISLLLLAAGAALTFAAAALTWITVGSAVAGATLDLDGGACVPALRAVALVGLAGIGGLLAARGVMRRVVGALVAGAALVALVAVVGAVRDGFSTIAAEARPVSLDGSPAVVLHSSAVGPTVAIVGLLLLAGGGIVAAIAPTNSAGLSDRFSRSDSSANSNSTNAARPAGDSAALDVANPATLWSALDRGEDPTRPSD